MSFTEKYNAIRDLADKEIAELKAEILKEIQSATGIKSELEAYINAPSKHIRALIVFLCLKALQMPVTKEQIKLQAIVELVHNASLIHDDVIDDSKERRKQDSFNKKSGNHLAVIAGDYILSFALKNLADLGSIELINLFAQTLSDMCRGEILQQQSIFNIPTMEEYLNKTYYKTGSLFETAMNGALILCIEDNPKLKEFAKNFGIAFQLRDDIKNIIENRPDSDIKNGIYTAAVIYSKSPNNPFTGIEKAKILLDNYIETAKSLLNELPENQYKTAIIELLEIINNE